MPSRIDPLTHLRYSSEFYLYPETFEKEFGAVYAIAVFDPIGLKRYNRNFGREKGDERITSLLAHMKSSLPEGTFFYHGYESDILAIFPGKKEIEAIASCEKVVASLPQKTLFGIADSLKNKGLLTVVEQVYYDLRMKKVLEPESSRSQILNALVCVLEQSDPETEEHVLRTRATGAALGKKVGLSDAQLSTLQLLCLLHDIGKVSVPLDILNKPGKLTPREWDIIRRHVEKGAAIVSRVEALSPLTEMVLDHHERWDGKGYPRGLKGEEIPVLSRIISIVDAYDAMVNDRSYRPAMSIERAKKEIEDNAGTQFDPRLAKAFLEVLEEKPELAVGKKLGAEVKVYQTREPVALGEGNVKPIDYCEYLLDVENKIIEVDDAFERFTGYTPEETLGKIRQIDLLPPEDVEYYRSSVYNQFATKDFAYVKHKIRRKDGSDISVACLGQRYFDSATKSYRTDILIFEL